MYPIISAKTRNMEGNLPQKVLFRFCMKNMCRRLKPENSVFITQAEEKVL